MAHHFTKKKSRLQNAEKASVAQIIANNNETLSKLIDGERTKVGFSGKTASTLNDVSVNSSPSVVEELLLSEKTEAVGVNDDLFLKDNSLTLDDESEIPSFQAHQDLTSATPLIDAEKQRIAQTNATADGPFDKSLPSGGREIGHSAAYLANEKAKTEAANDEANALMIAKHNVTHGTNYLNPVEVDVSGNSSSTAYRSMHGDMDEVNGLKQAEMFANGGTESYYFQTQDENGNDISVLIENEAEEKSIGVDSENLFIQNSKDGLIAQERNGIGFTSDEITRQAIKQAADLGAEERETMSAEEIENISESIADKSKRLVEEEASKYKGRGTIVEGDDERAAYLQREIDKEKGKTPIEGRFDKARERQKLEEAKATEETAKKQREAHDQFQNDRIDRIAAGESTAESGALRKQMHENAQRMSANFPKSVEKSKIPDKFVTEGDKVGKPDLLVGTDPFRFTTLNYPSDITTSPEYGHYMLFYVNVQNKTKYKYHGYNDDGNYATIGDVVETQSYTTDAIQGPAGSGTATTSTAPNTKYTTNYHFNTGAREQGLADDISYLRGGVQAGRPGNELQSNQVTLMRQRPPTDGIGARVDLTSRITDSVALYLPPDVTSNVNASYTGFDMGLLGYLALGGADIVNQVKNRDFEGAAENFIGTGERMLTEMIKKAGITAVDTAFNLGGATEGVFNKIFGQTTNPFIEVAFNNMSLRDFSYTFNFRPRNADETAEVKAIIQLFRFHMAPELKGTNHRYMTLPSTFDIHYMYQTDPETATENTFYNKIATCVLERCDVNYTPTGVKSFDDGAPTEISMSLGFKETTLLTKDKINKGF